MFLSSLQILSFHHILFLQQHWKTTFRKEYFYQQVDWNRCLSGDLIFLLGSSMKHPRITSWKAKSEEIRGIIIILIKHYFSPKKSYPYCCFWSFNLVLPKSENLSFLSVLSLALRNSSCFSLRSFCPFVMLPLSAVQWPLLLSMLAYLQWWGLCSSSSTSFRLRPPENCGEFKIVFPVFLSSNLNIIDLQSLSVSVFKSSYLWRKSMRRDLSFLGKICCTLGEISSIFC